jgi:hypothetical protein
MAQNLEKYFPITSHLTCDLGFSWKNAPDVLGYSLHNASTDENGNRDDDLPSPYITFDEPLVFPHMPFVVSPITSSWVVSNSFACMIEVPSINTPFGE